MKPTVVFLHGLARTHRSMSILRREVERSGHATWSRSYPSRHLGLGELAHWVADRIGEDVGDVPVVGVTHSLGGILVRHMTDLLRWQGVVMLAPPNRGSRVATALKDNPLFRWFFGPAGQQLPDPVGWPPPPLPCAVIAGTASASAFAPPAWVTRAAGVIAPGEPSDGIVTVSETRLEEMSDFATVPASHTWIMNHPDVREMVVRFLEHGRLKDS